MDADVGPRKQPESVEEQEWDRQNTGEASAGTVAGLFVSHHGTAILIMLME